MLYRYRVCVKIDSKDDESNSPKHTMHLQIDYHTSNIAKRITGNLSIVHYAH